MNTIFNQQSIEEAESIVCSGQYNIQVKVASANLPEHNKKKSLQKQVVQIYFHSITLQEKKEWIPLCIDG